MEGVIPVVFEWRFDDSYPDSVKDSLADGFEGPVMDWIREMIPVLINELVTKPDRKTALTAQGSDTSAEIKGGKVSLLTILSFVRSDGGAECSVYVGTANYIQNKVEQFKAQWTSRLSKPGTEANSIEWQKPGRTE